MNDPVIFAIVAAVKDAYKSLENPNFSFVADAMKRQGYAPLLGRLQQSFDVHETTDENDDVAFTCLVSSKTQDLGVWLSMVGPYALVQRVAQDHVETLRKPYSTAETEVLEALSAHHVTLVSDELLQHRIQMNLPETGAGTVTLYQALFDNNQALPWGAQEWSEDSPDA